MKLIAKLMAALVAMLTLVGVALLIGMRRKSPAVINAVRKFNREVTNPQQMETAGTPGAYAAIIKHKGRKSGTPYETPVGVVTTDDGFLITLPYGRQADWLKNVLAEGSATLVHEGAAYEVDNPEVISLETAAASLAEKDVRVARLFGVEECLSIRRAG